MNLFGMGLYFGLLEDGSGINSCLRVSKAQNVGNKADSPPGNAMQLGPPMRPIAEGPYVGKSTRPPEVHESSNKKRPPHAETAYNSEHTPKVAATSYAKAFTGPHPADGRTVNSPGNSTAPLMELKYAKPLREDGRVKVKPRWILYRADMGNGSSPLLDTL